MVDCANNTWSLSNSRYVDMYNPLPMHIYPAERVVEKVFDRLINYKYQAWKPAGCFHGCQNMPKQKCSEAAFA